MRLAAATLRPALFVVVGRRFRAVFVLLVLQTFRQAFFNTGGLVQNLRLPGQQFDAETGIYHNGFRDYVPNLGRYLESDPIGLAGGLNTYAYVGANPLAGVIGLTFYSIGYLGKFFADAFESV